MAQFDTLSGKRLLIGVSGGIAAYKSPDLVRRLREQGAETRVMMSRGAARFITPLTLQAVSGQRVHDEWLDAEAEAGMGHIELARWAELLLIAPATAHCLAKLAHGLADDLLSTVCLASNAPLAVAPAMNQRMWAAPATQDNCRLLAQRGVRLWGPAEGAQACGESGAGRMLEPLELVERAAALFAPQVLAGARVLVTAGPTREDLDPVRYLSNRSSGRMGYAIARAAQEAGARVTLVSGPVCLEAPAGIARVSVYSAQDMLEAVLARLDGTDIFIANAAVADYRPAQVAGHKLKKDRAETTLRLEPTPDILATVAARPKPPFTVGFAAETENLEAYAQDKLKRKKLDMIAANPVNLPGLGFDSPRNWLKLFWPGGGLELPPGEKTDLARRLVQVIAERRAVAGR
jgi:phosphopantothenoylcysteine decarboxylase/phosphopantothenate--cysteine ligase